MNIGTSIQIIMSEGGNLKMKLKKAKKKMTGEDSIRLVIKETCSEVKSAKEKRRAIRQECPHQKPNGKQMIVPYIDDNGNVVRGVYKCKRCGAKVDLRPLKKIEGKNLVQVSKDARDTEFALGEFLKISSNISKKEDAIICRLASKTIRAVDRLHRVYKSINKHKRLIAKDKKRNKRYNDVMITAGGSGF